MRSQRRGAFTLVEVLIVVVIMAVLAATIIPQFTNSTIDAKHSAAKFNLHTVRAQIEVYKAEHSGLLPSATFDELTSKTDADGTINATSGVYGPYMQEVPTNPINNKNTIAVSTESPIVTVSSGGEGWLYNVTTGEVRINDATLISF